ncbi:hypothetical protein WNY51_13960 [Pseudocolwellia sp. AS88]|uniref:hypothetical protein n=1 Tax=Pseudocolwellia sp. AS88 TaxID=3063958 RepID=UPI0026F24207|nr:hypothetical protein [Pseudocolwellia sp. AS88]MDO7084014.1 hypothetical protein [Pseudocolwellia sp. AS88]
MSKYIKGFTPLEAALLAVGLEKHKQIPQLQYPQFLPETKSEQFVPPKTKKLMEEHNEAVTEAEEILKALEDETILAYQALRGEKNKTELVIYAEFYNDETQESILLERTKLTKESLALWFTNIGEVEKANKFSQTIKKSSKPIHINKFNKGFTAEHCALLATGLDNYNDLTTAIKMSNEQYEALDQQAADAAIDFWYEIDTDPNLENDMVSVAIKLKEALCDEIEIAFECQVYNQTVVEYAEIGMTQTPPNQFTDIEIYKLSFLNNDSSKDIDLENTKITKSSLAIWLWENSHEDLAKNVQSNISECMDEAATHNKNNYQQSTTNIEKLSMVGKETQKIRTPNSSLIDSLGIMAWLLSQKSNTFKIGDKPNFSQIKKAVESSVESLGLDENEENKVMTSNLNRDIKVAFDQLTTKLDSK